MEQGRRAEMKTFTKVFCFQKKTSKNKLINTILDLAYLSFLWCDVDNF